MEWNSAIHLPIPRVIFLRASIHVKHGGIGQKDSDNKEASYDFHIQFLPSNGSRLSVEILSHPGSEGFRFEHSVENRSFLICVEIRAEISISPVWKYCHDDPSVKGFR